MEISLQLEYFISTSNTQIIHRLKLFSNLNLKLMLLCHDSEDYCDAKEKS